MKKVLLVLLLIILCSVAALFIWRYVNYMNDPDPNRTFLVPRVGMSVIEISSLTADKTEMNVSVLVKNTLPFSFTADSFQYRFYINDAEIMKSRYKKAISLQANDSSWVSLPVTVFNHDLDSVITANEKRGNDSAEYRIRASFYTDLFFKKRFTVSMKRYLPLIHIPDLKLNKIEVDSLNLKRAAINVHASIKNDNVFDIRVKDYSYEVQIEDHEWVRGTVPGKTVLKAQAVTDIEIPVTISFKEVGKTIFQLLKKGSDVDYDLVLTLIIQSDMDMMKDSKAVIKSKGTVKSLLKAAKGSD